MSSAERVRAMGGPQITVICYLLQAGWDPRAPTCWSTPCNGTGAEHSWEFNTKTLTGFEELDVPSELLDEYEASARAE
eukprot:7075139-Pyramimonas_sp.AAC.1